MKVTAQSQRGQIIVLFALVLVGLIAFAGLAVDSAMVYSDRRFDQSAADGAALAGAGAAGNVMQTRDVYSFKDFDCSMFNVAGTKMNAAKHEAIDAAINRASQNSVTLDNDVSDQHGVVVTCVNIGSLPTQKYIEVFVQVTSTTDTSFAHLVSSAPLTSTVTSVARVYPPTTQAYGNAILSLDKKNCSTGADKGGIEFGGGIDVNITGGGIFSSSCISGNGANHVMADEPGVNYMTTYNPPTASGSYILPAPPATPVVEELPPQTISTPVCPSLASDPANNINSDGASPLSPGNYGSITLQNNENLVLQPGLYCLTGDFSISGSATVSGYGVTIFMQKKGTNQFTNFTVSGSGAVNLTAPDPHGADPAPALRGVLIRMANDNNKGIITLEGTGDGSFGGTIYGPNNEIKIGGTSGTETNKTLYNTELISDKVTISGNTVININYDDMDFAIREAWLTLIR